MYPSSIRRCHRPTKAVKATSIIPEHKSDWPQALEERLKSVEVTLRQLTLAIEQQTSSAPDVPDDERGQPETGTDKLKSHTIDALEEIVRDIAYQLLPHGAETKTSECIDGVVRLPSPLWAFKLKDVPSFMYPSELQTKTLWRQFQQIADQQVKIVHRPQAEAILLRAFSSYEFLSESEIALAFAIYFAALASMSDDQVMTSFSVSRSRPIPIFQKAAEGALMRANFLSDQSLTTVQAMTLIATFSRYVKDDQKAWPLTGMARLMTPTSSTMTGKAFEMEMRRRIWWCLWYLDYRALINDGEEPEPSNTSLLPEFPRNIFDHEISPETVSIPLSRETWTPVSFSLMNFTIARTALDIERSQNWLQKQTLMETCASKVQTAFLQHCIGTEPVHWLARHVAHVHFTALRMNLHSQQTQQLAALPTSSLARNRLVVDVTDILDVPSRLQREPLSNRWKWTLSSFPHFTHLSFLLNEISQLQIHPPPSHLWTIVEQAFSRAEMTMTASSKTRLLLRSSKGRAEDGLKTLLQWQRQANEIENVQQIHTSGSGRIGDAYAGEFPITDMLGPDANMVLDHTASYASQYFDAPTYSTSPENNDIRNEFGGNPDQILDIELGLFIDTEPRLGPA